MAQQTDQDFYYYLTFRAVGSFYMARLNGATFSDQSRVRRHEFAVPINLYLQPGENVLEFIFVPGWGEEWALGEPNPEFAMFASLMELNLQTRAERNFGIANVSFDMERGEVVPREATSLGPSQPAGTADFGRVGPMEVSNGTYTDIHGPPLEARVLRFRFNVPSELPAFPWADAPPLQDSMTLRTELAAAYERVHNATSAGDFASIQRAFEPAWTHASQAMAYDSVAEFLEAGGQEKAFVPVREDGNTLGPLSFLPSLKDVRLEIMDDGKLVRFDPAPLHWVQPGDPPKRAFSSHIAFYRGADGGLKIGSVLLGL